MQYINVLADRAALDQMLKYSKGERKVPVIVEQEQVQIGFAGGS